MKAGPIIAVLCVLCIEVALGAEDKRQFPKAIGPCFTVHGRLSIYNGTPSVRIWIIGTKRLLGVVDYENPRKSEDLVLPEEIKKSLGWSKLIYGDYIVCPVSHYKSGEMQSVYVKSASKLIYREWAKHERR